MQRTPGSDVMSGAMVRRSIGVCVLAACVFLLEAVGAEMPQAELAAKIDQYVASFVGTGNFTGAVLVARKGRVLFRKAYGMANYELQVPNSPDTRFHIASVSKPFTAAAILQLQEQGRLRVSDKVSRYVPDFPNGDRIIIDNLLTHTSGIPNVNDLPDYDTFARSPHTPKELVAKFAGLPLEFQPGTDYHYSNSNYNLLALILENVTGESYGAYVRKHVLEPAGMNASGNDGNAFELIPHAASGYQPAGVNGYENAAYLDWSNKTGNGSLYSTFDDLYRFDRALNTDAVLNAATRRAYFVEGRGNRYGWFIRNRHGRAVMSSNGRSPGFTAELDRYVDDDVTVIVVSNSYATVSQDPIAEGIAAIVFGGQPPKPPEMRAVRVPQATLARYAGQYQFGPDYFVPNAVFTLTAEAGYLLLELKDYRTPLVPLSALEFLERNFFGHVVMSAKAEGEVSGLVYRYAGKDFVAKRLAGTSPRKQGKDDSSGH
jgi:CubicO group peptidase (beta-lactamase class C family)